MLTCYFSAVARPNVILGPDLSLLCEGTVPLSPCPCVPLFFPGTDDEADRAYEDLLTGKAAVFEDDGPVDNFSNPNNDMPGPLQDNQMEVDGGEFQSNDEASSPLPTKTACHLCQAPKISFVFDDATGDFVESHPTIFLPRPAAPPASSQGPR